jgi:LPS sulfotransferase NodH
MRAWSMLLSLRGRQNAASLAVLSGESSLITYIICTNPRSGSSLLCEGLRSTFMAGRPREWFNPRWENFRRIRPGSNEIDDVAFAAYIDQVRLRSSTLNGISGIKLHFYQFGPLIERLLEVGGFEGLTPAEAVNKAFPNLRYLWLTRRDKARQAISYVLAKKTRNWWQTNETVITSDTINESDFEPLTVAAIEEDLQQNDAAWQAYFAGNNIAPLTIYYEDLAADYRGTVISVLRWLGVPAADSAIVRPPHLKRQSDSVNEEWLLRYVMFRSQQGSQAPESPSGPV